MGLCIINRCGHSVAWSITSGLGPLNPGSNPGGHILYIKLIRRLKMSIKRFGARYGRKPKKKFAAYEASARSKHKCPECNKVNVKRVAVGIWSCRSCGFYGAGKAYSLS